MREYQFNPSILLKNKSFLNEDLNFNELLDKLISVQGLANAGSPGEKDNAKVLADRILKKIEFHFGSSKAQQAKVEAERRAYKPNGGSSSKTTYREPPKQEKPKQEKTWQDRDWGRWKDKVHDEPRAEKGHKDQAKSYNKAEEGSGFFHDKTTNFTFHIGRYTDDAYGKKGSDKVWGYAFKDKLGSTDEYDVFVFYGKVGGTLTIEPTSFNDARKRWSVKQKKYKPVNVEKNPAEYAFIFNQF